MTRFLQISLLLGLIVVLVGLTTIFTNVLSWEDFKFWESGEVATASAGQEALIQRRSLDNESQRLELIQAALEKRQQELDERERKQVIEENKLQSRLAEMETRDRNVELQRMNDKARDERLRTIAAYVGSSPPEAGALQLDALEIQDIIEVLNILDSVAASEGRTSLSSVLLNTMLQNPEMSEKARQVFQSLARYDMRVDILPTAG